MMKVVKLLKQLGVYFFMPIHTTQGMKDSLLHPDKCFK